MLLRAETVPAVKRYIDWYSANWNWGDRFGLYGTIDDFHLDPQTGAWTKAGSYDSASTNAATFITLLRKNFEKTGQFILPQSNLDLMTGGIGIMGSQDADGLMWKLPNEKIKRLVDNVRTSEGMTDSVWLFRNHFQAEGPAGYFESFAGALQNGIQSVLWNDEQGWYYSSIDDKQAKQAPDWTVKRDANAELAAIYTGIAAPGGDKAKRLYAQYNKSFPGWAHKDDLSGDDAGAVYTAALMGDWPRASAYLARLLKMLRAGSSPAGWTVEDAGYIMLAADLVRTAEISRTAPMWPNGSRLAASDLTQTSLRLSWAPATDDISDSVYVDING